MRKAIIRTDHLKKQREQNSCFSGDLLQLHEVNQFQINCAVWKFHIRKADSNLKEIN